jgi:hypothetical protein
LLAQVERIEPAAGCNEDRKDKEREIAEQDHVSNSAFANLIARSSASQANQ